MSKTRYRFTQEDTKMILQRLDPLRGNVENMMEECRELSKVFGCSPESILQKYYRETRKPSEDVIEESKKKRQDIRFMLNEVMREIDEITKERDYWKDKYKELVERKGS